MPIYAIGGPKQTVPFPAPALIADVIHNYLAGFVRHWHSIMQLAFAANQDAAKPTGHERAEAVLDIPRERLARGDTGDLEQHVGGKQQREQTAAGTGITHRGHPRWMPANGSG
ncbi:hypothetical protein J3R80_17180 [Aliiroseovarius sp. Z3]|uniref:hypothetical protein n=1 Tax=Aliiroseovarius sp. Z3 TaxID=2811402 RepID=UPI0023B356B9|nr:hypothetical protein [Aliiroseovarius sp. Z3]MDE9452208.1 hypothetical protein [Aliiroseovarius sp. Z3]